MEESLKELTSFLGDFNFIVEETLEDDVFDGLFVGEYFLSTEEDCVFEEVKVPKERVGVH